MPYDDETGHSYFENDEEAEQWDSLYVLELFPWPFPSYYDQRQTPMPIIDETPFIPQDPLARPLPCLQCNKPYHAEAICPPTFQDIPSAMELLNRDAGASIYSEGDVTRSTSSAGFITIRRETRPRNPDQ